MSRLFLIIPCLLYLQNTATSLNITSNVDENLCKFLSTIPNGTVHKTINVILGSEETDIDDCLKAINHPIVVELMSDLKDVNKTRIFNIIFLNSFEELRKFQKSFSSNLFNTHGYYVISLLVKYFDMDGFFDWFWKNQILNVDLVYDGQVFTYFPFSKSKCGNVKPQIIGKIKNLQEFSSFSQIFPSKISNLHNCTVRIATTKQSPPFVHVEMINNDTFSKIYGRDISLINMLSEMINFKVNYTYVGAEGAMHENGSALGVFFRLTKNTADLAIGDLWLTYVRTKHVDSTLPYIMSHVYLVVPPVTPMSSYEILVLPFDYIMWSSIGLLTAIELLIIILMKCLPKKVDHIASDPFLDVLAGILGGSQPKLPRKNLRRLFLMSFLLFWLILRTLYQAKLFHFMGSDMMHKQMQTIDEIVKHNKTIYVQKALKDFVLPMPNLGRIQVVPIVELEILLKKIHDPNFDGAIPRSIGSIHYHNQINYNTSNVYDILNELFFSIHIVIYTRKNFYLNPKIDELIEKLQAAGFTSYWHDLMIDKRFINMKKDDEPKQLNLNHLESCFGIFIIGCLISILVFIAENIRRFKK